MPHYLNASQDDLRTRLARLSPYRAIAILEEEVDSVTRDQITRLLCDTDCRYLMAWGQECESFHDSVDFEIARLQVLDKIPDEVFMMTTWHDDETLDEVFEFAKNTACFDDLPIDEGETVLLHFGDASKLEEYLERFEKS